MILSNLRAHPAFLTILLILCCFFAHSAIASQAQLPASLYNVLQGTASDLLSVSSELKDTDLPAALSIIELLKFKVLHQETAVTTEQINKFELLIKNRLNSSSVVSFSETETCCSKVNSHEIEVDGQKITVPEYYVANVGLIITDVIPAGEAGTVFPDIQINFISRSPITEYSLNIDGNTVPNSKISVFDDDIEQGLIFRSDLNVESILSIGTHTAVISISNEKGDQAKKHWTFTVGILDTSEPPLPEGATIVKELPISPERILSGSKGAGELCVIVYQDKNGRRYTSYKLVTSSGMTMQSRNLAFIARAMNSNKKGFLNLGILPSLSYAFAGNHITFSYLYESSEPGEVIKDTWQIDSGGHIYSDPSIIFLGYTTVKCELLVEHIYTDSNGQVHNYQSTYNPPDRNINEFQVKSYIYDNVYNINRAFHIGEGTHEFPLSGRVSIENGIWGNFIEGGEYIDTSGAGGILTVNRLRWKAINSEGEPQIKNVVASQTAILFTKPGFAEVAFDVELTWEQSGLTLKSSFKPNTSGLYAFYPATGNVEFKTFHPAQLSSTQRYLEIKNYSVEINGQKRLVESESGWKFAQPMVLSRSIIDPASYPLQVENAWPAILSTPTSGYPNGRPLTQNSIFKYLTLSANAGTMPLRLFCEFQQYSGGYIPTTKLSFVKDLPPISVYNSVDVMETILHPSEVNSIQEGQQQVFSAEVRPKAGFGEGSLSSSTTDINVLDGYKYNRLRYIRWVDRPLFQSDIGEIAEEGLNYNHIFNSKSGIGSYSLDCNAYIYLDDAETKKTWGRYVPSSNPIEVTPGLRILSPIDKLAYPLNQTIKVTTTMDSEEHTGEWEKIKWKLNDKDFFPDVEKPPFSIQLDHVGKWKIEAVLETKDLNGSDIVLKDSAEFEVKPIEISISPAKKVLDFKTDKNYELKASVFVNGTEIQKPGESVTWQDNSTKIVIDSIVWDSVTKPDKCAAINPVPQTLKANCEFDSAGATTALATITVRIIGAKKLFDKKHKGFKDKFEEQIFEIPAGRADIWALEPAIWQELYSNLPDKLFPSQAVSPAGRTFTIKDGLVKFDGKEYPWATETGFNDHISIPAALQDETHPSATCSKIEFEWSCADNSPSNSITFIPTLKKSGSAVVKLKSSLIFDGNDTIPFIEKEFPVSVQDIETLVRYYIDPEIYQMTLGETKQFSFFINPIAFPGHAKNNRSLEFSILNDVYKVTVDKTDWSWVIASETFSMKADSVLNFNPTRPGAYKLFCNVYCSIIENRFPQLANSSSWPWNPIAANNVNVVNGKPEIVFCVNGISLNDSPKIYLGQKISLSFKAFLNGESVPVSSYTWQVDQPFTSEFKIIDDNQSASEIIPGKVIDNQPVEFLVYSYDRKDKRKTFHLTYNYDGRTYSQAGEFSFVGPDIEKYGYKQAKPEIYRAGTVMRCGYYPPNHHVDYITVKNPTDSMFSICAAQLVSLKFARRFDDSSKEGFEFSNYLDNGFPYKKGYPIVGDIFPGQSLNDEKFFEDIPNYPFQEIATASMPILYESKSNFSVFVFFRPVLPNGYWVPVLRYNWLWRANSERVDEIWSEVPGAFFPPASLNIEYVKEVPLSNNEASELGFPKWDKYFDNEDGYPWKKQ